MSHRQESRGPATQCSEGLVAMDAGSRPMEGGDGVSTEVSTAPTLPRYLVSARHRVPPARGSDQGWQPYSTYHAREVGASRTVCGLPALGWPYFWDLRFVPRQPMACLDCSRAVSNLEA